MTSKLFRGDNFNLIYFESRKTEQIWVVGGHPGTVGFYFKPASFFGPSQVWEIRTSVRQCTKHA